MRTQDLDRGIECLKGSPIYAMSLASRELFHSNLLDWIFRTIPGALVALDASPPREIGGGPDSPWRIGPDAPSLSTSREENDLDLVIRVLGSYTIVIENKVKSLVDVDQLARYRKRVMDSPQRYPNPRFILLTLDALHHSDISPGWEHVRYCALAQGLLRYLQQTPINEYPRYIIEDYCSVVRTLTELSEATPEGWAQPAEALRALRIADLVEKRKAQRLHREFLRLRPDALPDPRQMESRREGVAYIYHGMSNGHGFFGCVTVVGAISTSHGSPPIPLAVGMQVQGDELRSYVEFQLQPGTAKATTGLAAAAVAVFSSVSAKGWWTAGMPSDRGRVRDSARQYDDRMFFRYRVLKSDGTGISMADLAQQMSDGLSAAVGAQSAVVEAAQSALTHE